MPAGTLIKFRRDTAANWTSANPILRAGEPAFETDTYKIKIGDGATAWNSLDYLASGSGGAFTDLTDVPASYTGAAGKLVAVNGTEDGLEFIDTPSSVHAGTATLAAGTVTVSAAWVTPDTVIVVAAQAAPGTAGTNLYVDPANIVDGVSFDISSDDVTDTRAVFWMATEPTEVGGPSGFALQSDGSGGDAYLEKDLGTPAAEVWLTFDFAFDAANLAFNEAQGSGGAEFAGLWNVDPTEMIAWWVGSGANWNNGGVGGGNVSSPAPIADTWQHLEYHYEGSTATFEFYINGTLAHTHTGSPDPSLDIQFVQIGQHFAYGDPAETNVFYRSVKIGTTREGSEILSEDFSGDLTAWTVTGACTIVADPY